LRESAKKEYGQNSGDLRENLFKKDLTSSSQRKEYENFDLDETSLQFKKRSSQ
jgi:hypothetical protein